MRKLIGPETAYAAGKRYKDRKNYRDALDAFTQAHTQWQATRGVDDAWTVTALVAVAHCKLQLGDLSGAAEDLNAVLLLRAANPDAKDMPREVDINNQLAWVSERLRG